jgi:sulfur-oxidizing protein SoxX
MRRAASLGLFGLLAAACPGLAADGSAAVRFAIEGDAIPRPLVGTAGDAARGRALVLDRRQGNCLICHRVPVPEEPFQGELGPDLSGIGGRLSPGQIRLRLVDQARLNPATLMPPYFRTEGLTRVADRYKGKPVLAASEIEDVVAWLTTLK